MFRDKVAAAQKAGRLGNCTCWDCLRAIGMTPPYMVRDKYPRQYPHTIFNDRDEEQYDHGDPMGQPRGNRRKAKKEEQVTQAEAAERRALRAAVRNREVI